LRAESLVHHCHVLRVWAVGIGKDAAGKQSICNVPKYPGVT